MIELSLLTVLVLSVCAPQVLGNAPMPDKCYTCGDSVITPPCSAYNDSLGAPFLCPGSEGYCQATYDEDVATSRGCVHVCTETLTRDPELGRTGTHCCTSDLCNDNGGSGVTAAWFTMTTMATVAFVTSYI